MERVRIVKPFLIMSIVTLSVVAGGVRLASNKNHWEDVAVGFALGALLAIYLVRSSPDVDQLRFAALCPR